MQWKKAPLPGSGPLRFCSFLCLLHCWSALQVLGDILLHSTPTMTLNTQYLSEHNSSNLGCVITCNSSVQITPVQIILCSRSGIPTPGHLLPTSVYLCSRWCFPWFSQDAYCVSQVTKQCCPDNLCMLAYHLTLTHAPVVRLLLLYNCGLALAWATQKMLPPCSGLKPTLSNEVCVSTLRKHPFQVFHF